MSFNFGQFRSSQMTSYSIPRTMELKIEQSNSMAGNESILFYNRYGELTGENQVNNLNCYYLEFSVKRRSDSEQNFYLKLQNSESTEDNEQLIEEFKVAKGNSGRETLDIIIAPNAGYNRFVWELQRTALDYRMLNADGTYGRIMDVTVNTYTQLTDIISEKLVSDYPNLERLTKIGIQGPPSLLMCINREQIRIGKNGIYEINNGININSISFIPKNTTDYFIMDFEY